MSMRRRLELFPITTEVTPDVQELAIAGQPLRALAEVYGTPLYLFDRATLDDAVDGYRSALAKHYPGGSAITYAGKAGLPLALAQWAFSRDLRLDCTGVGEMAVARAAGVPASHVLVHGVNKSADDLALALAVAGTIVVDNLAELGRLSDLHRAGAALPELWLRVRPGAAVETHSYRQTGQIDSKFGMDGAETAEAVTRCLRQGLPLGGLHFHQGSHFHDPAPLAPAIEMVLDLVEELRTWSGWTPPALCTGGGWGVAYHEDELPHPPVESYIAAVARGVVEGCAARGLPLPVLHVEPGRSIVARAGVAIYRVGAVKHTPARRWLLLDGGMADNIRPALYGARYSALPVAGLERPLAGPAWLGGPYCESGDVLIEALQMPELAEGEYVAVPVSGAYHASMSSNYNGACRPALLWLERGRAALIRRRETPNDLLARDHPLPV